MADLPTELAKPDRRIQVVTSETAQAFYNERLTKPDALVVKFDKPQDMQNLVDDGKEKPKAAPVEEEDEHEEVKQARKEKPKLNERFSELTQKRKDAEAKAKSESEARQAAERQIADLKAKYEAPKAKEPLGPKPEPAKYDTVNAYTEALEKWTEEKIERDHETKETERKAKEEKENRTKAWLERQAKTREKMKDYDARIAQSEVRVSEPVQEAILESEVGPEILYHLAEHPELADDIGKLTVAGALRAVGRLEAKLMADAERAAKAEARAAKAEAKEDEEEQEKPAVKVAEVSKAPAPISPIKSGSATMGVPVDSNGKFHGTYEQFKKLRESGKLK